MTSPTLELQELPETASRALIDGSSALASSGGNAVTLRFRIAASDPEALEALRHARRSLLREERTLGVEADEPSLENAIFSPAEILWTVDPSQRDWSLRKVRELVARAQRTLSDGLEGPPAAPRS